MPNQNNERRVVVTGMGTVNALGHDVDTTWEKIRAGVSGIDKITQFDASEHKTQIAAEVKGFDPIPLMGKRDARRTDRATQLAWAAADEALTDANFEQIPEEVRASAGVILGTGIGGIHATETNDKILREKGPSRLSPHFIPMMLADSIPARISLAYTLRGPNMAIATACASSTNAIGEAAQMIKYRGYDLMVTGGSEATITPLIIAGFNVMGAMSTWNHDPQRASRPFDLERNGFVPGEGAAILVLEELEHAKARGAHIYAEIAGYGTSADAYHVTAPQEDGEGAIRSMNLALEQAGLQPQEIDYMNAHGTSTQLNDRMETNAIKRLLGEDAYNLSISSTKSMHGHLLGATGALEMVISISAMNANIVPPTTNYTTPDPDLDLDYTVNGAKPKTINTFMSNSFGFGGHNATLIARTVD
ncbi:MAG: beta-ketoacyl-ACP synthase II [Chloroflexota bacterium]